MSRSRCRSLSVVSLAITILGGPYAPPARADEIWVAPTNQADLGGLGIASNVFWPVTPIGVVRLAWGVPDNLQTFQSAKVVLIPHSPGGAATLNLFICPAESGDPAAGGCVGPIAQGFTGVANQLLEVDVSAAIAPHVSIAGQTNLAVLAFTTPTTVTDHIVGLRFAYEPALPNGVAALGANTFTGTQTAPAFVGGGSGLTNVAAANTDLLDGLDSTAFASAAHGHDVSQVTGAARLVSNSFTATQTISTGNLDLDASTATTGNITKDGVRFLHNVGVQNLFLGREAGNFTTTGSENTAIGVSALQAIAGGGGNVATGYRAMFSNTAGYFNTASGVFALAGNTSGGNNTAVGAAALNQNTTGSFNTAMGDSAQGATTGSNNVAVGFVAGGAATTGSNNIYLGALVQGAAGESNTMYLGRVGTQTKTFIAGVRGITTVNPDAINVMIDSAGQLGTVSSSRRFKEDIQNMADASRRIFDLRPVTFRYKQAYGDGSMPTQFGLVAEEVAAVFPELAVRGADGQVETVHYEKLSVLLLNELQRQERQMEHMLQRLAGLEDAIRP